MNLPNSVFGAHSVPRLVKSHQTSNMSDTFRPQQLRGMCSSQAICVWLKREGKEQLGPNPLLLHVPCNNASCLLVSFAKSAFPLHFARRCGQRT